MIAILGSLIQRHIRRDVTVKLNIHPVASFLGNVFDIQAYMLQMRDCQKNDIFLIETWPQK